MRDRRIGALILARGCKVSAPRARLIGLDRPNRAPPSGAHGARQGWISSRAPSKAPSSEPAPAQSRARARAGCGHRRQAATARAAKRPCWHTRAGSASRSCVEAQRSGSSRDKAAARPVSAIAASAKRSDRGRCCPGALSRRPSIKELLRILPSWAPLAARIMAGGER